MLKLSALEKSYGARDLFTDLNLSVNYGERIGLIGRNGHGKSTLLKIIAGMEDADHGDVIISKDYQLGFLQQHLKFTKATVLAEACLGLPVDETGTDQSYLAKAILDGLGFTQAQYEASPASLSGGFQIRLNLAKLLVSKPDLLLLDEPTNYLDIISVRWLSRFLNNWPGELILITHDHTFMNSVITHTIGIHRGSVKKIEGTTDKYYRQIELEEEQTEKTRENQLKKRQETEQFINRFRAQASKAKAVQSRIKALAREDDIEELSEIKQLKFKFPFSEFRGDFPLHVEGLSFGYEQSEPLIENLSFSLGTKERLAIIGKNGKGKTTLLNLLAKELAADHTEESVVYNQKAEIAYFGQTNVDRLNPELTIEAEVMSENPTLARSKVRSVCGTMMFSGADAEKKISVLSGGEKARVLLAKILVRPANVLILDEPTNHLDLQSCQALIKALKEYPGTIIFVTHDENLLNKVAKKLVVFEETEQFVFDHGYRDFLKKVGWQEEADLNPKKSAGSSPKINKAERRRLRAQLQQEQRSVLKPISNRISKVEAEIIKLESVIAKDSEKLEGADSAAEQEKLIWDLSKDLGVNQEKVDQLFAELESLSEEETKHSQFYQDKIAELR